MKSTTVAIALFAFTAAAVVVYPGVRSGVPSTPATGPVPSQTQTGGGPKVDVVFVLDTTGSMGGLIQAAKEKIWSIAGTMAQAQPAPEIRMGLVAYRDRGDDYVTRIVDLSADLDTVYATLMDFRAEGGGDGPESVNQALYDAVHRISWNQDSDTYRVVFLVGDAPPHMDYQDDVKWSETVEVARSAGIPVNAIQCGQDGSAAEAWKQIAGLGQGNYFQVEQSGSAVAIATPYDARLAELSAELDGTRMPYGSTEDRERQERKRAATEKLHASSSVASRARRAAFNASASGAVNLADDKDLVDDLSSGSADLSDISRDELPAPMQSMSPAEQKAVIAETAERRRELKREINSLAGQRAAYLRERVEAGGGADASLDHGIFRAVKEQARESGLHYEAEAPSY